MPEIQMPKLSDTMTEGTLVAWKKKKGDKVVTGDVIDQLPADDIRRVLALQPGVVGAHCDKGLLILDGQAPGLGGFVLPGNNYHAYDFALFWGAVRRDAERRLAGWH